MHLHSAKSTNFELIKSNTPYNDEHCTYNICRYSQVATKTQHSTANQLICCTDWHYSSSGKQRKTV